MPNASSQGSGKRSPGRRRAAPPLAGGARAQRPAGAACGGRAPPRPPPTTWPRTLPASAAVAGPRPTKARPRRRVAGGRPGGTGAGDRLGPSPGQSPGRHLCRLGVRGLDRLRGAHQPALPPARRRLRGVDPDPARAHFQLPAATPPAEAPARFLVHGPGRAPAGRAVAGGQAAGRLRAPRPDLHPPDPGDGAGGVTSGLGPAPQLLGGGCEYRTGRRVVFGRRGSPCSDLADAVAASCSIPGFFRPVWIGGRPYVDGGLNSPSNLDLLVGHGLEVVICLNPLSSRYTEPGFHPLHKAGEAISWLAAHQVDGEAGRLLAAGTAVVMIEPTAYDLVAIGGNRMDARRCRLVFEVALRSVTRQLREPG